jgi:hypothetical protein
MAGSSEEDKVDAMKKDKWLCFGIIEIREKEMTKQRGSPPLTQHFTSLLRFHVQD